MCDSHPLLTIAIPTYNRLLYLKESLHWLMPQLKAHPSVEILICNNASPDGTREYLESIATHPQIRIVHHSENIGSDSNFLFCFEKARGTFFWLLGDDDVLLPSTLDTLVPHLQPENIDLAYISSYGFTGSYQPRIANDLLGRDTEVISDRSYFLSYVNAGIGLISAIVINRSLLLTLTRPEISALRDTNLIQLGWVFPLLRRPARILFIWKKLIAYRLHNTGGWGACEVFGVRMNRIAFTYFADQPELARSLMNAILMQWMPPSIQSIRMGKQSHMFEEDFHKILIKDFRGNWRYWMYVWPIATWPIPIMKIIYTIENITVRANRLLQSSIRHFLRANEKV